LIVIDSFDRWLQFNFASYQYSTIFNEIIVIADYLTHDFFNFPLILYLSEADAPSLNAKFIQQYLIHLQSNFPIFIFLA